MHKKYADYFQYRATPPPNKTNSALPRVLLFIPSRQSNLRTPFNPLRLLSTHIRQLSALNSRSALTKTTRGTLRRSNRNANKTFKVCKRL